MHQKRKVDGVLVTRRESRVVEQRRKRVADGVANHTVNSRRPIEQMCAIELKHVAKRNLAGRGRLRHRSIGQLAAFAQGKKARRQPDIPHGYGHKVSRARGNLQQANAVGDGPGLRRDFYGIHLTVPRNDDVARQVRGALEIVDRE